MMPLTEKFWREDRPGVFVRGLIVNHSQEFAQLPKVGDASERDPSLVVIAPPRPDPAGNPKDQSFGTVILVEYGPKS